MINQKLLVSGADYFADTYEINPYYTQKSIDVQKAQAEHAAILACFRKAGIELVKVDPPKDCQDGVYTANWALVKDGVAVMSRLPEARKAEEPYAKTQLEKQGIKTILVPDNHLFSGQGDSLICGKYLFAGRGYRSDPEAQEFAADVFGLKLIQVHAKPQLNDDGTEHINPFTNHADSFWYDIDLAISVIDEHTIAYCRDALDEESQQKIDALTDIEKLSSITMSALKVSPTTSSAPANTSLCPTKLQNSKPNSKSVASSVSLQMSLSLRKAAATSVASASGSVEVQYLLAFALINIPNS